MAFDELFDRLQRSQFRKRFRLDAKDARYLATKGMPSVLEHAREFLLERLAPAEPANDGAQTPMRGHPAFVAQHATGTCCRSCLLKWHRLEKGRALTSGEVDMLVHVLGEWLRRQNIEPVKPAEEQLSFF
jgi:hypothetical protein